MKKDSSRKKIGVLGPFSFGNLGNAALQETVVQHLLQNFADVELYGCCVDPDEPAGAHQVFPFPFDRRVPWPQSTAKLVILHEKGVTPKSRGQIREWIRRTSPFSVIWRSAAATWARTKTAKEELEFSLRAYRFAKEFRLFVVGLGGVFDEVWGGKWKDLYSLFRWAVIARLSGTPLIFLSVGVEEIRTRVAKFLCRNALLLSQYRSFRDAESMQKVEVIGVHGKNHVFPDLAFGLRHQCCKEDRTSREGRRAIGVSPMAYCDPRFWPIKNLAVYEEYLRKLTDFVSWLLRNGYEVVLFPTQIRMDRMAIRELYAAVCQSVPDELHERLSNVSVRTVEECLALLARLEVVVTSRLHGVILSCLVATPVIAISPASKIDRLMEELELTEYLFDIHRIELAALVVGLQKAETNREFVANVMRRAAHMYRLRVEAQFEEALSVSA